MSEKVQNCEAGTKKYGIMQQDLKIWYAYNIGRKQKGMCKCRQCISR